MFDGTLFAHAALAGGLSHCGFLALLAVLVRYTAVSIPVVDAYTFETLLIGFLLLLAGNMLRGF